MPYILYLILFLFASCTPSLPDGILSHDDMEDVLYDMHMAQTLYDNNEGRSSDGDILALRASVLKKHGIDEAMWDSSYNYYCRNVHEMREIYESLMPRLERNIIALGGQVDGVQSDEADTANVWKSESAFILMQQAPYNVRTFTILPDSTFEDGDRITLQYDAQMLFQDGYRDVTALLAVTYSNDSTTTTVVHTNSDGHGIASINNDVNRLHIRSIRGYFLLAQNLTVQSTNPNGTTMRLAALRNVKLLHLRTLPPAPAKTEPQEETPVDSLRTDSLIRDSVLKAHAATAVINKTK